MINEKAQMLANHLAENVCINMVQYTVDGKKVHIPFEVDQVKYHIGEMVKEIFNEDR